MRVEAKDQILARMYVVLTLLSLVPLLIAGQVLRIYLTEGAALQDKARQQYTSHVTVPALRGTIKDRQGRTLAVNTARYDVALDPTLDGFDERTFFDRLSKLTGKPASFYRQKVRESRSPQYVKLLRGVPEDWKEQIESWDVPGLILEPTFARRYNYGTTAAHVLGYVSADGTGLSGLELQYDAVLRGRDGRRTMRRDRLGVRKADVRGQYVEPKHGETLVLTIDLLRQTILEEELAKGVAASGANWGTAIAMDPHTGAILALANVPTYDPNRPAAFTESDRRNRAITDRIEPGSTFKLVAAVAAVEQGVVSLDEEIETGEGWAVFGRRTMRDTKAHGTISFAEVIARSSNIGTARVAQRLKPGVFYQYARNLGFGQPTWIDLPGEVAGRLKKPSEWSGTSLTSMSIGYEVDATPLQVLAAYSALANGGLLVQPYVVAERQDVTGRTTWRARQDSVRRAFEAETARALIPAFERAVQTGTAKRASIDGLPIAGKTGTAIKVGSGGYVSGAHRASFVGFFPADKPEVAMIVVLDEPERGGYGGDVAAPIFQRIARRWVTTFPTIAERMAPGGTFPEPSARPAPDVVGTPAAVAAHRLLAAGFQVEPPEDERARYLVAGQVPEAGAPAAPGTKARLELGSTAGDAGRMPDLTGWSARDAVFWLRSRGVQVRVEGTGTVERQSVARGEPIPASVVLRCGGAS